MKKIILSVLSVAAFSAAATAQIRIAPEVGLNMSNLKYKSDGGDESSTMKVGARIGAIIEFSFSDNLYLQPGLFYAMNGAKSSVDDGSGTKIDYTENLSTLEIPVNVIYKFGKPGGNRFFVGAGPYLGYNIGGKLKASGAPDYTLKIGSDKDKDDIKALDFGLGLNVGYELANGLFFRARYQMGLSNLSPYTDGGTSVKSSSFGVQVGYFFGGGSKGGKK